MSDYPTDEEVDRVRTWAFEAKGSFEDFMAYVKSIGRYWPNEFFGWEQDGRTYYISTGGWSGNEEILGAMKVNLIFWTVCRVESRRGGHYVFELPNPDTYFKAEAMKGKP